MPVSSSGRRLGLSAILAAAVLGPAVVTTPVAAAAGDLILTRIAIGERCWVAKNTVAGADIMIALRSATGSLKGEHVRAAAPAGAIKGCFPVPMVAGDRIHVAVDSAKRSFGVPNLRIADIARVPDRVRVRGPKGADVKVVVSRCPLGTAMGTGLDPADCTRRLTRTRTLDGQGRAMVDTTSSLDLRGHDVVELSRETATGDRIVVVRAVPVLTVRLRATQVTGVLLPGSSARLELRTANRTLRGRVTLPGSTGGVTRSWKLDGATITLRPGQRVAASSANPGGFMDVGMAVPDGLTAANAAQDRVKGECLPGRAYRISGPGIDAIAASSSSNGGFMEEVPGLDPGDELTLECLTRSGDVVIDRLIAK